MTNEKELNNQVPLIELVLDKCWKPDCRKIAVCKDEGRWKWCEEHLDQEKTGQWPHRLEQVLDIDYYQKRIKDLLHSHTKEVNVDLLEKYSDFLHKNGYIDSDYYTEEPTAVDRFLASLEDNNK